MLITLEYIKRMVNEIDQCDNDEKAHMMEDKLHRSVLYQIARRSVLGDGGASSQELATAAIMTGTLGFHRWYSKPKPVTSGEE